MKTSLGLLLLMALSAPAALLHFDLSPPGKDVAVGLSASNEVPAVTNSTGTGNTISGGIVLNTDTLEFLITVGYGSAAGFTDLSGPATAMHIHSPAGTGTNAGVEIPLINYNFSAANPAKGGVIYGTFLFPTNGVTNLLAGLDYVNIHTTLNPNGEIRGQLLMSQATNSVPTNSPPMVSCPAASTVECGTPALVTAMVGDPDGDALTVVWTVNGMAVETNSLTASNTLAHVSFMATLPLGTNHITVTATDTGTNSASCATTVTVVDTTPPVIVSAHAEPSVLWPPNHKFVDVRVFAQVTDTCDATSWKIISVSSNESAPGSWIITGDHTVKLKAERSGGSSRVYTITIQAQDASGNLSSTRAVTVTVPKSQGDDDEGHQGHQGQQGHDR
jgi:hypothetical protein